MNSTSYFVGFKDVYPWVWSVILGVSLTLADRRGAFQSAGTDTAQRFWIKNSISVLINVAAPAFVFGITMTRLGPLYPEDMNLWEILGSLYLAGVPLGMHHAWLFVAEKFNWIVLNPQEARAVSLSPNAHLLWAVLAAFIPTFAAIVRWRVPF
jgi:hypothetical protein